MKAKSLSYIPVEQTSSPILSSPNAYFFRVVPSNTANLPRIIDEICKDTPDVSRETITHVLMSERKTLKRLLLSGWRINNGFFEAVIQARGLTYDGKWNPQVNSLYVNFQQGKELCEALKEVVVSVSGKRQKPFYISGCKDCATERTDFVASPGNCFTLLGKNIKIAGTHPSVGITLTNKQKENFRIPVEDIIVNWPSKLVFFISKHIPENEYELAVTTQYSSGGHLLKAPRSVSLFIRIENQES